MRADIGWSADIAPRLTGFTAAEAESLFLTGLPVAAEDLGLGGAMAEAQLKLMAVLPPESRDRAGSAERAGPPRRAGLVPGCLRRSPSGSRRRRGVALALCAPSLPALGGPARGHADG